jgi:peptidoglycan/LPS O-acetylase OafA/YrhL
VSAAPHRAALTGPLTDAPSHIDLALIARGLAAYQVLVWHVSGYLAQGTAANLLMVSGRQCVWIFFVLSGYLISHGFLTGRYSLDRGGVGRFYRARFLRIVPLYLFLTVVTVCTLLAVGQTEKVDAQRVLQALFFLSIDYTYPGVFWTIVIEFWFYGLFPVVAWLIALLPERARLGALLAAYFALACYPLAAAVFLGHSPDNRTLLGNFSHFMAGIAVHFVAADARRAAERWSLSAFIIALTAAALVILCCTNYLYHVKPRLFWALGGVLTDAVAVLVLLVHVPVEARRFSATGIWLALSVLGILAYGIYAWHGFLVIVFPALEGHLVTVTLLSLALAWASYCWIERPALMFRKRRMRIGLPSQHEA